METIPSTPQLPIPEEELQRRMPKRRIGFAAWATVAAVAFVGFPLAAYWAWDQAVRHAFERRLAELQAASYPTSVQELEDYYPTPPPPQDTTPLWQFVLAHVETNQYSEAAAGLPYVDGHEPPLADKDKWLADAEAFLQQQAEYLVVLHEAAARGGAARYPIEFADGYKALITHVQAMHRVIDLLRLESHVHAVHGDAGAVTQSLQTGFAAMESLREEPILVSQIARVLWVRRLVDSMAWTLAEIDFRDDQLVSLQRTLRACNFRNSFRRAFIGEQALSIVAFHTEDAEQQLLQMQQVRVGHERFLSMLGSRDEDLTLYIRFMAGMIEAVDQPWPQAVLGAEAIAKEVEGITDSKLGEIRYALTRLYYSSPARHGEIMRTAADGEAWLQLADMMLAATRYQNKHGALPEDINQLVPDFLPVIPSDPWSPTQPLQYRCDQRQATLSSVGFVPTNAAGQVPPAASPTPDLVLTLRLPRAGEATREEGTSRE